MADRGAPVSDLNPLGAGLLWGAGWVGRPWVPEAGGCWGWSVRLPRPQFGPYTSPIVSDGRWEHPHRVGRALVRSSTRANAAPLKLPFLERQLALPRTTTAPPGAALTPKCPPLSPSRHVPVPCPVPVSKPAPRFPWFPSTPPSVVLALLPPLLPSKEPTPHARPAHLFAPLCPCPLPPPSSRTAGERRCRGQRRTRAAVAAVAQGQAAPREGSGWASSRAVGARGQAAPALGRTGSSQGAAPNSRVSGLSAGGTAPGAAATPASPCHSSRRFSRRPTTRGRLHGDRPLPGSSGAAGAGMRKRGCPGALPYTAPRCVSRLVPHGRRRSRSDSRGRMTPPRWWPNTRPLINSRPRICGSTR